MPEPAPMTFRQEILKLGVISHDAQDSAWDIAQKCARQVGVPMGAGGAVIGLKAGTVTVPGVGTVSGALVGFLAGLAGGTMMCTAANMGYRDELAELLK